MADLLPPPLAGDERFMQLCSLMEQRFGAVNLNTLLVYLIDLVTPSALPVLAEQFHATGLEGWAFTRTEEERRRLIKNAIELHKYKGTPWAIKQVLKTLAQSGQVTEWFDYQGKPYCFKVMLDFVTHGIDEVTCNALIAMIHEYKDVRSYLEALEFHVINQSKVPVIACCSIDGETVLIRPYIRTHLNQHKPITWGMATSCIESILVYPKEH